MKALAIVSTFWAIGAAAAALLIPVPKQTFGWTSYEPPQSSLWTSAPPLALFMTWLAAMLALTALGAWTAVLIRWRRGRRTEPSLSSA